MKPLLLGSALAGLVGLSLFVSACGGSPGSHVAQLGTTATKTQGSSLSTASAGSVQQKGLAFSRCMRSHGVPNFPDPNSEGQFPLFHSDSAASKQASLSAQDACKSLLPSGGSSGTPQDRQEKFAFALKVAHCLRAHEFPNFPDPSQGTRQNLSGAGIDTNSPQFQAVETACEQHARKALGLP